MKSTQFYGKSKTPATLSRLDLAEENDWPYRNAYQYRVAA